MEPFDVRDAGRMAVLADPEGAVFCVWQAKEHKGAELVNEPGSLNFNSLNTRDAEGAKAFYGAVFGWEALELGAVSRCGLCPATATTSSATIPTCASVSTRWAARRGSRTRLLSIGPIADDQPEHRAHWGVTFAVDNADAIAKRPRRSAGT